MIPVHTSRYKVFDYPWHTPHQYDMANALSDHCDFFLCLNAKKQWDLSRRPVPQNVTFVTHYEENKYDIAILHIDQEHMVPYCTARIIFEQFDKRIQDVPKIIINHGSPVFPEGFNKLGIYGLTATEMQRQCIESIKSLVKDRLMVVNSYAAASEKEWGFGLPVIHGIDVNDWLDAPIKEPRVFTAMSTTGFDTYYNRQCMLDVYEYLMERYGYTLAYAGLNIDTKQSPLAYRDYLGHSLLYLDTSFRTPMNRARTEAFLSGCCVVQVEGAHDLERWAVHNTNIVLVPNDVKVITETLVDLMETRYADALKIGQNGKRMAMGCFAPERYRQDWLGILTRVIKN